MLDFNLANDDVRALENALAEASGPAHWQLLITLAWHLRQRDCTRAWQLVHEAEAAIAAIAAIAPIAPKGAAGLLDAPFDSNATPTPHHHHHHHHHHHPALRLMLVRAEIRFLAGDLTAARTLVAAVLAALPQPAAALAESAKYAAAASATAQVPEPLALTDAAIVRADAHWLSASLYFQQGNMASFDAELLAMQAIAAQHDPVRNTVAQAVLATNAALRNTAAAKAEFGDHFLPGKVSGNPVAQCWVEHFHAMLGSLGSDYLAAIRHWSHAHTHASHTGQVRWAIVTAANIGDIFNHLNDYDTALQWLQRALQLARNTGWPVVTSWAMIQTAETRRRLQHFDAANELLHEALDLLTPSAQSMVYATALQCLGNVELARHDYASAQATFESLEQRASVLKLAAMQTAARRGQAQALLEQGHAEAALRMASAAQAASIDHADGQIAALRIMAEIHARHALPAPEGMQAASIALHYLEQVLALAAQIESYTLPGELLDFVAQQYANVGLHAQAFEHARAASLARQKTHNQDSGKRALALQIHQATERTRLEVEQHKQLAAFEAHRAEALQQTRATLDHLATIGQEITACLEDWRIFRILDQYLHLLLDVTSFVVFNLSEDGQTLELAFGMEGEQPLPPMQILLDDANSHTAQCIRERREILSEYEIAESGHYQVTGTRFNLSRMYAPLILAGRVLGAITIQSAKAHAYGEREQLIFRTLCAYTAIALANADAHSKLASAHTRLAAAHQQLQDTQQQMIMQGKMAGLGTLTAGVAHEINNPTNFIHGAAQNQRVDILDFEHFVLALIDADDAPEVLQSFNQRFARLQENVATMLDGTERIKRIVKDLSSFTQLDDASLSGKKTARLSDCLHSTLNLVRANWLKQVEFVLDIYDDPEIECWPALLNQVFMNLLVNGCQAIEAKLAGNNAGQPMAGNAEQAGSIWHGKLSLRLFAQGDALVVEIEDNGIGIAKETQARIMEPFFTTKEVGKGTGLGLSTAFGIVEKHGGKLGFHSRPGTGSCFTVQLPLGGKVA